MNAIKFVVDTIEENKATYIEAAANIWEYAELAFQEKRSADELQKILQKDDFTIKTGLAGLETAFLAEWGMGDPIIGFLGEYDALPGLSQRADSFEIDPIVDGGAGHGCGHHILGTGAMAAAITVKRYLVDNHLHGTIRFYGCPAEEGGFGKIHMAMGGLFDDLSCAITWHPADDNNIWSMNFLAIASLTIRFHGISAHAPSQVHLGRNALSAAELMNVGINYLRGQVLKDVCINYAYIDAGGPAPNVIPNYCEVACTIRAATHRRAKDAAKRVESIAKGAAMMMECDAEVIYRGGLSELIPNRTLERLAYRQFELIGPTPVTSEDLFFCSEMRKTFPSDSENSTFSTLEYLYGKNARELIDKIKGKNVNDVLYEYKEISIPKYGSTDVCDVSWFTPTLQLTTACYAKDTPGHSWQQVSQGKRPLCFNGMLTAAKVMALTAIELINNPSEVRAMRDEFENKMSDKTYECPLPSNEFSR